ncbi:hypothetical protein EDC04DRAFT_3090897 [Pisolithus marmoratus]|nr:hypothetical protein EDC04DRAFT_3090897 [Pisolithus marmoratus]
MKVGRYQCADETLDVDEQRLAKHRRRNCGYHIQGGIDIGNMDSSEGEENVMITDPSRLSRMRETASRRCGGHACSRSPRMLVLPYHTVIEWRSDGVMLATREVTVNVGGNLRSDEVNMSTRSLMIDDQHWMYSASELSERLLALTKDTIRFPSILPGPWHVPATYILSLSGVQASPSGIVDRRPPGYGDNKESGEKLGKHTGTDCSVAFPPLIKGLIKGSGAPVTALAYGDDQGTKNRTLWSTQIDSRYPPTQYCLSILYWDWDLGAALIYIDQCRPGYWPEGMMSAREWNTGQKNDQTIHSREETGPLEERGEEIYVRGTQKITGIWT